MKSWIRHFVGWIRCLEKDWIGVIKLMESDLPILYHKSKYDPIHK